MFVQLCKVVGELLKKLIRKEDVTSEKALAITLQKQTVKSQIVVGATSMVLLFVVFRSCGNSSPRESKPDAAPTPYGNSTSSVSNRNTVSVPNGEMEVKAEQAVKMPRTAQEAFARKVNPTLSQLAFVRDRPVEVKYGRITFRR